jgi:hypothetical protein
MTSDDILAEAREACDGDDRLVAIWLSSLAIGLLAEARANVSAGLLRLPPERPTAMKLSPPPIC